MPQNEFRRTIFVPVGTSLMAKAQQEKLYGQNVSRLRNSINESFKNCILQVSSDSNDDMRKIVWQNWRDCYCNDGHPIKFFTKYYDQVCPDKEIGRRKKGDIDEQNPDKLTAELASLYLLYEEMNQRAETTPVNAKDEVILLASDTDQGLYCACFLAEYLTTKEPYKNQIGKVHVERIVKLGGGDDKTFQKQGLDHLISRTTELIRERQGKRPLYLNVTGGYKGVLPYLVLLGLAFGEMGIFYLFELSPRIVRLPKLPVGFDLLTWRDYRAFLHSIPHIEGLREEDLKALIPDTMRTLLEHEEVDKKFPLTALGEELRKLYDEARGREISEYGRGHLLTDKIESSEKQKALKDCIDRWQYLWLGDLIPETVEHARGHVQRDLELLAQIIYPILIKERKFFGGDKRTDDSLLVLLSSIWLHDLGHSGDHLRYKNESGTIKDGGGIERDIRGFPSLVRDIHHFLSWYLIGKDKDELFKSKWNKKWGRNESIFDDNLIEAIRRVCLYHRGRMPASDRAKAYDHIGIEIKEPLESLTSDKVNLPLLGALLRIADAGEVQQERTVSEEYEAMRILQNERDIESLQKEEKSLREMVKAAFNGDSKPSLPHYLKCTMEVAEDYFNNPCANAIKLDALDTKVDKSIQEFVQEEGLSGLDRSCKLLLRNWLSALNQFMFKKRQPAHFDKHRGIIAIMYLLERTNTTKDNKSEYHFKVLAIYRKGDNQEETCRFIKNVEKVLKEEINGEYEKVKKILNDNRIYFDSCWRMEEDNDKIVMVWPKMPSDFRLGYYVTVKQPDRAWDIEVDAKGKFLFGCNRAPDYVHSNLTAEQLQNLWQCCVTSGIFQVEPVTTPSREENFIQLVVIKVNGKEYRWFLEKQIREPILHVLRLLGQYAYEANIPQVTSYMGHLIVSEEQKTIV